MPIETDAKVTIKGDGSGAQGAFRGVSDAASKAASTLNDFSTKHIGGLQASMDKVSGVLGTVMTRFTLMAAAVAGGAAVFKEGINESVAFTKEVNSLSKVLGISASEATAWNVALGDIYQDSGALIGAVGKLNRVIAEDEEKITALGIKTRDASGHLRAQGDIFQDVTKHIAGFKEGIDRNIEGARIFGKSWGEVAPLMKLTADNIEAAKQKAGELGLTVTKESAGNVAAYRASMNDVGDVMLALKNVIGQSVMPIFTRLGEWFSSIGPGAVLVFKGVLGGFATFFQGLINGLVIAWELLSSAIYTALAPLIGLGKAVFYALHGDMKAATAAMMDWPTEVANTWGRAFDNMASSSARTHADIANLWSKGTDAGGQGNGETSAPQGKKAAAGSRMGDFANVLAQQKKAFADGMALQEVFTEWGHKEESRYWAGILSRKDLSVEERRAVEGKWLDAENAMRRQSAGARLAGMLVQIDQARDNYALQEELAEQHLQAVAAQYGEESKQYEAALKNKLQIQREHQDKLREIQRLHIDAELADLEQALVEREARAQLEVELGVRTQESMLEVRRKGVQERLALELKALDDEQAAYTRGTVEFERLEARKAAARRKATGQEAGLARDETKLKAEPADNVFKAGEGAMSASLDAIVAKGRNAGAELGRIWRQAGNQMIHELTVKPLMAEAAAFARRLAVQAGFLTAKNAQEVAAAGVSVATEESIGLASVGASAARAAAGAYAAIAGIPVVGPVLAPVAAGVALAGVMSFGKHILSARGGMDIPAGVNPMVQLHEREQVLPQKYADVIRGFADGSIQPGGGGHTTVQIQALDARSFERMLSGPAGDQILRALARRARNGTVR